MRIGTDSCDIDDSVTIPALGPDGLLPDGVHDATLDEVEDRFGRFQETDRRVGLFATLREFVSALSAESLVEEIILDGSFVTAAADPNDIDLLLVLRVDHDFNAELRPAAYNLLARKRARRRYGMDVIPVPYGDSLGEWVEHFHGVRNRPDLRKGLIRLQV